MSLDYNEVIKFMKDFEVDILNRHDEMIIDSFTNTYAFIRDCKTIEDVEVMVVYAIARPIAKGLEKPHAKRVLAKFNNYFHKNFTTDDFLPIYEHLCYNSALVGFKKFIEDDFPLDKVKEYRHYGTSK